MASMKVGTRLGLGFGAVIILMIVVAVVGTRSLTSVDEGLMDVVEDEFPKVVQANHAIHSINGIARAMRNALLETDKAKIDKELGRIEDERKVIEENLAKLEDSIKSEKGIAALNSVREARNAYVDSQELFINLVKEGRQAEARTLLLEQIRAMQSTYTASVDKLIDLQTERLSEIGAESAVLADRSVMTIIVLSIIALIVATVIAVLIVRSLMKQLGGEPDYAAEAVHKIAGGDLSMNLEVRTGDTTSLLYSLKTMQDSLKSIVSEIQHIVEEANKGNFSVKMDMAGKAGYTKTLSELLNQLFSTVDTAFRDTIHVAQALAKGDLTQVVTRDYQGAYDEVKQSLNGTVANLKELVGQIKDATDTINTASKEIASGNADLSQRTEEQASSLEETASSMEELTSTVKQNAENAKQANQLAIGASDVAGKGGTVVSEVVTTMDSITESSRKIADIISVIDGIAFQTNILALNAAVEAARAGEQGRGFAVVAGEVRNLAQRSAAAAKEIKGLIEDSVSKVEDGSKLVGQAGQTMEEIVTSIKRVTDIMSEITAASVEQSTGIEQVNLAITQMDEVTQQNAALVEEAAAAAESLEEQAQSLAMAVGSFKMDSAGAAAVRRESPPAPPAVRKTAQPTAPAKAGKAVKAAKPATKPKALPKPAGDDEEWQEF